MSTELTATVSETETEREIAAIARMIAFARQSAHAQALDLVTYCLDTALAAALEELDKSAANAAEAQVHVEALCGEVVH
ncbi:hypothetical protein [Rhodobium gokarnense]|uniref:Uncharacterized protein n=1 Tax=Rhodobium gokarnense TaxID=364296 RepID=A0ABT3HAF4_9HYPH|nr:hypothetical protein [Rhodobium gokarnense]MCW2307376.1 hypothetical protein [Rhodobium gokarnense]